MEADFVLPGGFTPIVFKERTAAATKINSNVKVARKILHDDNPDL